MKIYAFLGKLIKKVKRAVNQVFRSTGLGGGPILERLRRLVRPLLGRVLRAAAWPLP